MLQRPSVLNPMEESEASAFTEREQTIRPVVIILTNMSPKHLLEVSREAY